jgi:lysylphosphatidylglycerol synthetase-like protein (DUF2156 family)
VGWSRDFLLHLRATTTFLVRALRTTPFTLSIIAAILTTTAITNTLAHPITPDMLARWGFGLNQVRSGYFYPLLFAPFQVLRPYMAMTITAIILLFVGAAEYRLGTWRAALAFAAGHFVGYTGGFAVTALLGRAGLEWAKSASLVTDVGASNGAFGAAGAVVLFVGGRSRKVAFFAISVYLVGALALAGKLWDVEHILAFSTGLVVGRTYLWHLGRHWPGLLPRWQIEHRQRPAVLAWAIRVTGIINILAAFLLPHHAGFTRLQALLPVGGPNWPRHLLLVTGLVLLTLAPGLAKRQRTAWWVTLVVLVLSALTHIQVGLHGLEATMVLAFVVLLLAWRREFRASSDPPSLRSGLRLLASLAVLVPLYALTGFYILRSRFEIPVTVGNAFGDVVARVFFLPGTSTVASGRPAEWFLDSIPVVAWLGVTYSIARIVRASIGPKATPNDVELAQQLLARHGSASSSYMTLWEGNSLFFGPEQHSYVAYRVHAAVALALGDPVGPADSWEETIREFTAHARTRGWDPVFYAASATLVETYREAGYEALQIGDEAVIPLPGLEFRGKEWQNIRTAVNRADREGMAFHMLEGGSIPSELRQQIFEISEEWVAARGLPPMGFTLGKTEDVDDPNINVAVAVDGTGRVQAFADWLPVYARRGWVIDLMRRRDDAMPGVMDFLIGTSLMAFKERGYRMASLATAPLAGLEHSDASLVHWILRRIYEGSHTYYDFGSLFRYKEKFRPHWEHIYLMHPGLTTLPAVAVALARAYLPDVGLADATKLLGESAARRLFPRGAGPGDQTP